MDKEFAGMVAEDTQLSGSIFEDDAIRDYEPINLCTYTCCAPTSPRRRFQSQSRAHRRRLRQ